MLKRIAVTGSRTAGEEHYAFVATALDTLFLNTPVESRVVIHGGQTGVDAMADLYCQRIGAQPVACEIPQIRWDRVGRKAGPMRNALMMTFEPELLVAFPGGSGTRSAIRIARSKGIAIARYEWSDE